MNTIIQRSKGTVRFSFNKTSETLNQNKSKEHLIYIFFSYGRQRFKYSTGYKCCFNNWDFKKQRVRNKAGILNKDEINDHLDDLERFLVKEYATLSKSKKVVSKGLLKRKLDVFTNKRTA